MVREFQKRNEGGGEIDLSKFLFFFFFNAVINP